jgi:hypothetical protein
MFTSSSLQIGDLSIKTMAVIAENILNINVNYAMDMSNQLSFTVIDPGFEMAANNYFQVGRDVVYETTGFRTQNIPNTVDTTGIPITARFRHLYEISSASVQQSGSASPQWTIEALPKAVQQMKRDKKPGNIGGSGYEFVRKAANKYGLNFVGEKSAKIKSASKNSGDKQADSVWTVITSIAQNSQYVVFVADGTLYFASEKWLMYKWGSEKIIGKPKLDKSGKPIKDRKGNPEKHPDKFFVPLEYPPTTAANARKFEVLQLPRLRKSENDPMAGDGSLMVSRDNGVQLRPGMTIRINNVPTMNKFYLITSVSYGEQITDPVSVEFRTPERLEVNGKPAKIPALPIGKIFQSEYFQPSPRLGATSVGLPTFAEKPSSFVSAGTTMNPTGPQTAGVLPNARRPSIYPTRLVEFLHLTEPSRAPNPADILESGNIDLWNRPIIITKSDDSSFCATSRPHIYEKYLPLYDETVFIIVERIWCDTGVPVLFTTSQAESKYDTDNVHHGIFANLNSAKKYVSILIKLQKELVKKRFPTSYIEIWNGTVVTKTFQQPVYPTVSQITAAGLPANLYPTTPTPLDYGNINLLYRPLIKNEDGSISTLLTSSFNDGFNEVLYTPIINGTIYSDEDAQQHYLTTGEHLGKFASGNISDAETYAENLHTIQEDWLDLITYQEIKVPQNGRCS